MQIQPKYILLVIFKYVSFQDILNLRGVCKKIQQAATEVLLNHNITINKITAKNKMLLQGQHIIIDKIFYKHIPRFGNLKSLSLKTNCKYSVLKKLMFGLCASAKELSYLHISYKNLCNPKNATILPLKLQHISIYNCSDKYELNLTLPEVKTLDIHFSHSNWCNLYKFIEKFPKMKKINIKSHPFLTNSREGADCKKN